MRKADLYNIWKKDYLLDDILIDKIILKNLNISKNNLFLMSEIEDSENILKDFEKYKSWYPIEYILWEAEFYSLKFFVDNRVLIPRNDTEILVSQVVESLKNKDKSNDKMVLIDVWTWSSCIPISILRNLKKLPKKTYVLDISKDALEVSKVNIEKHNLQDEITQIESDLLRVFFSSPPARGELEGGTLIITANLPYIKNEDFENMDNWVFFFEPNVALFWWKETWFELYEKLISQISKLKDIYKPKNIVLFIEIWFDQYEYSKKYLENLKLDFEYFEDMNGISRTIKIYF